MTPATPWSDPDALESLSRKKVGRDLARRVVARLVERDGRYGVYNAHRDYCGHGLVYDEGCFRLVEVHDGYARQGRTLMSWNDRDAFVGWLARQSDFSLSGADPDQPELHSTEPFNLNNQRLTRERLLTHLHGGPALVAFLDYLDGMDLALRFLIDDYGFVRLSPHMVGRECVVNYRRRPHAGLTVISEFLTTPFIMASKRDSGEQDGYDNQLLHLLARKRAPDWHLPAWRQGEIADYRAYFDAYAELLKDHFPDLLGDAREPAEGERQWLPEKTQQEPATAARLTGLAISLVALMLMFAELSYFVSHDTPSATGSVYGNLGLMMLMSVPWVALVTGLLQATLGVSLRRLNDAFSALSVLQRVLLGTAVIALSIVLTTVAATFT